MLHIEQLTLTNDSITCEEQKHVHGGGAGPHNVTKKSASSEPLWSGYAGEKYDIAATDNYIHFTDVVGDTVGSIDKDTGFVTMHDLGGY